MLFDMDLKTAICGGIAGAVLVIILIQRVHEVISPTRRFVSRLLDAIAERPENLSEVQRSLFNGTEFFPVNAVAGHTHGDAAADRSAATDFIVRVARRMGKDPFFFQSSRSNQRKGLEGSRTHFWAKDFNARSDVSQLRDRHLLAIVDTDHYVDMPKFLTAGLRPILVSTFQPDICAKDEGEYSYTFDKYGQLDYKVAGGGSYKHRIWDYGMDSIIARRKIFGLTWCAATYLVDKVRTSPDHYVICLTPLARWTGLSALFTPFIYGKELSRLNPVEGPFLRLNVQSKQGLQISTGLVGMHACATIPAHVDNGLASVSETSSIKITLPVCLGVLPPGDLISNRAKASVLLRYHRETHPPREAPYVFPVENAVRSYTAEPSNLDPETKPTLTAYMSPIVHGAFAPTNTPANERWCIAGRVTDLKPQKQPVMTKFIDVVMDEFVDELFSGVDRLIPCELDVVYDRQNRPSQRAILDRSLIEPAKSMIEMFMKREAGQTANTPRPISTINGTHKREYSRFIYPIANLLKSMKWYAFGDQPTEIAHRISDMLSDAETATNTDFSRFDGRVSSVIRRLEEKVLVRAYGPTYLHDIMELHRSQYNITAIGKHGSRYNTCYARASGSPETAAFNSIANAFVAFYTFRSTKRHGAFLRKRDAWNALGIYGGDDGLTPDVQPDIYTACASRLGLKLEAEVIQRGHQGVQFLSRIYGPNVWFGDPNSCCDILRQISKFHTTVNLPPNITAQDKLLEKSRSYYLTDRNTPVIGELVTAVIEAHGLPEVNEAMGRSIRWGSDLPQEVQYPNEDNGWMQDYATETLSKVGFDWDVFDAWLNKARKTRNFMQPPLCSVNPSAKPKARVAVDNDVVEPTPTKPEARKKNRRRRRPKDNRQ